MHRVFYTKDTRSPMHNLMSLCCVMSQACAFSRIRTIEEVVIGSRNEPWRFYPPDPTGIPARGRVSNPAARTDR
jgi:hypothetical protein